MPVSDVVTCEMGTCYLGPQYQLCGMIDDLKDIQVDNHLLKMDDYETKGGFELQVVTDGQFEENGPVMRLWKLNYFADIDLPYEPKKFPQWVGWPGNGRPKKGVYPFLKGFEEAYRKQASKLSDNDLKAKWGQPEKQGNMFKITQLEAICTYIREYYMVFGGLGVHPKFVKPNGSKMSPLGSLPMPEVRPEQHRELLELSMSEWLEKKNLLALAGVFQYTYAVQGYGSIDQGASSSITPIHLMIWLPATVFTQQLLALHMDKEKWAQVMNWLGDEGLKQEVNDFIEGLMDMKKTQPDEFNKLCLGTSRFSRGWGNLWVQQKQLLAASGVKIDYNVKVSKIQRPGIECSK